MKIGVIDVHESDGGVSQYTESLIRTLMLDNANEYVLFTNSKHDLEVFSEFEHRIIPEIGSRLSRVILWIYLILDCRCRFFINVFCRFKYDDIDFFIVPNNSFYPHYFLAKPFIFTLHDLQENYYPEYFTWKERFKRYIINKRLAKSAQKIICEAESVKNDVLKYITSKSEKIIVIKTPPLVSDYSGTLRTDFSLLKQSLKLPDRYILYPAQFWKHKNHENLIRAFEEVLLEGYDIFLVLSGSAQNNLVKVRKLLEEKGLGGRVIILGYIKYEYLLTIMKNAEFLIIPSLFESISIPIYEAFELGVPVCASSVCGIPEQVEDAALLFNPEDIQDIKGKMITMLNSDANMLDAMVVKGKRIITRRNKDVYLKELKELIGLR